MNTTPLTPQEIAHIAPSVMQMTAKPQLSDKYIHVPTSTLINDMTALGWDVVGVQQVRSRNEEKKPYVKHLVTFRNPNLLIKSKNGDDVCPQILITNSHDGLSSFQFRAGIFRLVCSNGLVVCTEDFGAISMRHKGYSFEKVQSVTMDFVKRMPQVIETLNKFTQVTLSEEQKIEFALSAIGIRFENGKSLVEAQDILKPTRVEDMGDDLWSVLNTIQERLIRGDFKYTPSTDRNKLRKARPIKNFKKDIELNEKLFNLAYQYI
jgi:hypothetical protein